jgi:hypothetical protein
LVVFAVAGYALLYLLGFWRTPFGMWPVLDAQENLVIARSLAAGTLPAEPYYRAMLYPAVLASMLATGIPPDKLPVAAGLLGLGCHALSTLLVYWSARVLWRGEGQSRVSLLAAALFGLNPVAVYFAGELLDATFALTLALAGVHGVLRAREAATGWRAAAWGGAAALGFGLATLARPHYLPVLAASPFLLAFTSPAAHLRWRAPLAGAAVGLAVLLASAGVQWAHRGHFAVVPWQGAYNLWAANKPTANGKYFAQELTGGLDVGEQRNPTRVESELLYARATGLPPTDVPAMNRYWRGLFLAHVRDAPVAWLGLMARKAYYLVNTFEQYNNKTFAYQRTLSPWLRWNPLHWGLTFVLAVAGAAVLWRGTDRRGAAILVAGIAFVYGAGTILYFPGDRFRLPLLPLAALFAGGAIRLGEARAWGRPYQVKAGLAVAAAAFLTYTPFLDAWDESTVVMDKVLLATAASQVGDDRRAAEVVREIVGDPRTSTQATAIFLQSYANLRMDPDWRSTVSAFGDWAALEPLWNGPVGSHPSLAFARAAHLWNTGRRAEAVARWRGLAADPVDPSAPSALACLILAGALREEDAPLVNAYLTAGATRMTPMLHSALTRWIAPERLTLPQVELVRMYQRLLGLPEG